MTKEGILELEQRRFKAMCDGEADALGALLHGDLTYTHSSGTVDSKESYTRGVRDKLWDYQRSAERREGLAARWHRAGALPLRIDVKVGGVPKIVESVALAAWVDDGGWKCIAVHSTPAPSDRSSPRSRVLRLLYFR